MIVGIDAGNRNVNTFDGRTLDCFRAAIGEWRQRNFDTKYGADDMEVEWNGCKLFAGTIATMESEFGGSIGGDSKAHEDALIRTLIALHRTGWEEEYQVVVGQPIKKHTETEKAAIKEMLVGKHEIKVNGLNKKFCIKRAEVAAEGCGAFWSQPSMGLRRIIDIGSYTVNYATILDKRYVDRDSNTLAFGVDTRLTADDEAMARAICAELLKKWKKQDNVDVCGGDAEKFVQHIQKHFPRAKVLRPMLNIDGTAKPVHPVYANAIGNYMIARGVYAAGTSKA